MQASTQVLLRFLVVVLLLIAAACVAAGRGRVCRGGAHSDTAKYSIHDWHGGSIIGQWYVFIASLFYVMVAMLLCCVACRGEWRTRHGEGSALLCGFLIIGIAAALETFYVASWDSDGCYCESWAVACGFLWVCALLFLWDAYCTHKDRFIIVLY